jgi:hypothetical protein
MAGLKERAAQATGKAREELNRQLDDLSEKREAARKKYEELKPVAGEAWQDVKSGLDEAMRDLKDAFKKASSRFDSDSGR